MVTAARLWTCAPLYSAPHPTGKPVRHPPPRLPQARSGKRTGFDRRARPVYTLPMTRKSLGFVELEWVCPTCNRRNPGSSASCHACGAPQPPDVKFEAPAQADLITDESTVAQLAQAAPDVACPYCRTRNRADATVCKQCGGDLVGGTARAAGDTVAGFVLGKRADVQCTACGAANPAGHMICVSCGAPLPRPAPPPLQAATKANGRGCLWIAAAFALVVILGIVALFSLGGGGERTTLEARVTEGRWARSIGIEGLVPVRYSAWQDQIPPDATLGACSEEVRRTVDVLPDPAPPHRELCGTPYAIDRGTGMAEVVTDCVYQLLELRCAYTVNEWREVDRVVLEGSGLNATWPQTGLGGMQRLGSRNEAYQCLFAANDAAYAYQVPSYDLYQRCTPGARWEIEITGSGRVVRAAPLD